jgi:hypothetical protein
MWYFALLKNLNEELLLMMRIVEPWLQIHFSQPTFVTFALIIKVYLVFRKPNGLCSMCGTRSESYNIKKSASYEYMVRTAVPASQHFQFREMIII